MRKRKKTECEELCIYKEKKQKVIQPKAKYRTIVCKLETILHPQLADEEKKLFIDTIDSIVNLASCLTREVSILSNYVIKLMSEQEEPFPINFNGSTSWTQFF